MYRLAIVSSHPIQYNAPIFKALAARSDLEVHVFFSWRGPEAQPDIDFGRIVVWDIPLTQGYNSSFIENKSARPGSQRFFGLRNPGMCTAINSFKPDAVLVYGWASATHLAVLRYFHGRLPVLFRGDSTLSSSDRAWKAPFRKYILSWVYSHINRALAVGKSNREYFLAHGLIDRQISWVPHSVESERFSANDNEYQIEADRHRALLGIPPEACVFLFAGKFVQHKQPQLLIEAFKLLDRSTVRIQPHLVLVGSGPLEAELRSLAIKRDDIHFVGFKNQTEMPIAYRLGDVFVLPSTRETWGLAVNEAMSCGRPIIVSDHVGCAPDLAAVARFSTVFRSGDCHSLIAALERWLRPRADVLAAGRMARNFIAAWSNEVAAEAIARSVAQEVQGGKS